jgi:hypothetical protein
LIHNILGQTPKSWLVQVNHIRKMDQPVQPSRQREWQRYTIHYAQDAGMEVFDKGEQLFGTFVMVRVEGPGSLSERSFKKPLAS